MNGLTFVEVGEQDAVIRLPRDIEMLGDVERSGSPSSDP